MNESTRILREKDLKIDELQSDLKEAQNSTSSVYGNQFLENENVMLSMKVNELQQQLAEANNKIRRKLESPRKNRRREEPARQVQSPIKRSKVSEFDIDDPTKCNTQCSVCWTPDCVRIASQRRHSSVTPIMPTSFSCHPLWATTARCIDGDSPIIPIPS